jgi:hypothetical protein
MHKSVLLELAERVEKVTNGSRELDALIECEIRRQQAYALGLSDKVRSHWKPIGNKGEVIDDQGITRYHPRTFTFSIDDARTLIPEGRLWDVAMTPNGAAATVWDKGWTCPPDRHQITAATPALALVAASLRAHAQQDSTDAS